MSFGQSHAGIQGLLNIGAPPLGGRMLHAQAVSTLWYGTCMVTPSGQLKLTHTDPLYIWKVG